MAKWWPTFLLQKSIGGRLFNHEMASATVFFKALSKAFCFLLELSIKNLLLVLSDPGNTANRATVRTVGARGG